MAFGLTSVSAKIVDRERRGSGRETLTVVATGIRRSAAKRSARLEAIPVIPLRQQEVELIQEESTSKFTPNRYTFRISRE